MFERIPLLIARLRAFVRSADLDRDFEQELDAHVAMLTEDNIRRGMPPAEASRAARMRTGSASSLQLQHREARGLPGLDAVMQDLRFALRLFARDRWFSAAAVAALALGIGANATGFTIVNAVFLRGLPFEEGDRLHVLSWLNSSNQRTREIGVRVALGAQRRQVLWMILKSGLIRLAAGLGIGLAAGVVLTRAVSRGFIDVSTSHQATFVTIVALLSSVSIVACLVPVRRATRVDPVAALRAE